jgi:predicted DNA-binding protein
MMERTQIYLTQEERKALRMLAEQGNKSQSELIREAIDRYIDDELKQVDAAEILEKTFGIWADRDDLDGFIEDLRREADARIQSWE